MTFTPYPKEKNFYSERYLEFLRRQVSSASGKPGREDDQIVPAHQDGILPRGTALKPPDIVALPLLSNSEHSEEHRGHKEFWSKHNVNRERECLRLINKFLSEGGRF